MKHDGNVGGEASPTDGVDVTSMVGAAGYVFDLTSDPQREAFVGYQAAWRANEEHPSLHRAAALVQAWNSFATLMGLDLV